MLLQSASFDANPSPSRGDFLRVASRAFFAASLALEAIKDFSIIILASFGFSSKKRSNPSPKIVDTILRTSVDPNFDFVCPSNCGSGCFTLIIQVNPSRVSSPTNDSSFLKILLFLP